MLVKKKKNLREILIFLNNFCHFLYFYGPLTAALPPLGGFGRMPLLVMYSTTCFGTSANTSDARYCMPFAAKSLNETNCTISRSADAPFDARSKAPSPSKAFIELKSAPPTPMIMIDIGLVDALTIELIVFSRSLIYHRS